MASPRLGYGELVEGQSVPEVTANEMTRYLEQGAGHFIITDRDLATPPGSPAQGVCYLVAGSPTGAWASNAGDLAFYMGSAWEFITPLEGFSAWVSDEDVFLIYTGAAWAASNGGEEAANSDIWTGTNAAKYISSRRIFTAGEVQAATEAATITLNGNSGLNFSVTLTDNRTLGAPTNMKTGQTGILVVTQDGTGSRTLAFHTSWKFPGGAPLLSTGAGEVDIISYFVADAATPIIYATIAKDFS
jgi:hypothetical protein